MKAQLISVIIPVLNEENNITLLLDKISGLPGIEIIISDGGSDDCTVELCNSYSAKVLTSKPGRGGQLNIGAEAATGDILFFLHADTLVQEQVLADIRQAIASGYKWGCCTLEFNEDTLFFRLAAFFSNWRARWLSSCYGDQGIYCRRDLFEQMKGFSDSPFLEDIVFSHRVRHRYRARVVPGKVVTSTRRFREGGLLKTIIKMQYIKILFKLGISPERLAKLYYSDKQGDLLCEQ